MEFAGPDMMDLPSICMPWVAPILISALFLGFYDVSKKHAVGENSVMPVLFLATFSGSLFFLVFSSFTGELATHLQNFRQMLFPVMLKSLLVSCSWICMYYALRELPISIAAPIGASSPLWVFIGGLILYHEVPTLWQAVAMILVFCGYYLFSVFGKMEGVSIQNYRGIPLMILGTLFGACSALLDKYLMGVMQLPPRGVQFWFSVDLVLILGAAWLIREKCFGRHHPFHFRWSVPLTGILLI